MCFLLLFLIEVTIEAFEAMNVCLAFNLVVLW